MTRGSLGGQRTGTLTAPLPDRDIQLESIFPVLLTDGYTITSPRDTSYNCIAWAAGDATRWWWPAVFNGRPLGGTYWPPGVPPVVALDAFLAAYRTVGFERCDDGELEPEVEKVAVFVDGLGRPTHASRQLSNGEWTSKLGRSFDIGHRVPETVAGSEYGTVGLVLGRQRSRV